VQAVKAAVNFMKISSVGQELSVIREDSIKNSWCASHFSPEYKAVELIILP
jgi:hypothetical protein